MSRFRSYFSATALAIALWATGGCAGHGHAHGDGHGHVHEVTDEGLVMIDKGHYAEALVEDDGLVVYIVGADKTVSAPIAADKLVTRIKAHGASKAEWVFLRAAPLDGEPAGRSSCFRAALPELLHGKELQVVATVPMGDHRHKINFKIEP